MDVTAVPEVLCAALVLTGRPVLVVGGGRVAEQKLVRLLACGARVTVVAPEATAAVHAWHAAGEVAWHERCFVGGDVEGAVFVLTATGHAEVDGAVYAACEARAVLCNAADRPDRSSVWLLAQRRRGRIVIGAGTMGSAPGLAGRLADLAAATFTPTVERAVRAYANLRKARGAEAARVWRDLPWDEMAEREDRADVFEEREPEAEPKASTP